MNMQSCPKRFILSHKPSQHREQGLVHCGLFAAEGVISAYGKNPGGKHPSEFHQSFLQRIFGATPASLIAKVLQLHGFDVKIGNTKNITNEDRLLFLKENIVSDMPIIIHVGSGYGKNVKYKPILGKVVGHWVSLWGYDDDKEVFYIYDSVIKKSFYQDVPIGNTARPYKDVLRDWGQGFTPIPRYYEYVQILDV